MAITQVLCFFRLDDWLGLKFDGGFDDGFEVVYVLWRWFFLAVFGVAIWAVLYTKDTICLPSLLNRSVSAAQDLHFIVWFGHVGL